MPFLETTVQGREWALPADQGNGNRNSQIYVPHNDGPKEGSTRVDFVNASNQKFVSDLGSALSSYHEEDFGELGCGFSFC